MDELVSFVTASVLKRYRIDRLKAETAVRAFFIKDTALSEVILTEKTLAGVTRTAAFKTASSAVKKQIYYSLRNYKSDPSQMENLINELERISAGTPEAPEEYTGNSVSNSLLSNSAGNLCMKIAELHSSARERLPELNEFHEALFARIGTPETILDAGCGVYPLLFPFAGRGGGVKKYIAADADKLSIRAIEAFSRSLPGDRLKALKWDAGQGWEEIRTAAGIENFDAAFIFKLVPVIERQSPEKLKILSAIPAKLLAVTGSRLSLTKKQTIENRERAAIKKFAELTGKKIVSEFSVSQEFCVILK